MKNFIKQQGMTLIELTVVLLILTSLATIALRSTTGLVEQTRWEETKKRHEEIKKAIIGDPDLVINDQPDISGFVADMGRLPNNIRELLSQNYCADDYKIDPSVPTDCSTGNFKSQTPPPTPPSDLIYGWNGPYLTISGSVGDKFAFSDGWGGGAIALTDNNYGWNYMLTDAASPPTLPPAPPFEVLRFQSCGKNKVCSDTDTEYDKDYPVSPSPAATPPVIPEALVKDDWMVKISEGIKVNINSANIPGSCDLSTVTNGNACKDAGWAWPGAFKCIDPTTFVEIVPTPPAPAFNYSSCTATSPPVPSKLWRWQPHGCIDNSITAASTACSAAAVAAGGIWVAGPHCSDPAITDLALCTTPATLIAGFCTYPDNIETCTMVTTPPSTKEWAECIIGNAPPTHSKAFCETHGATWVPDAQDVCLTINYRSLDSSFTTEIIDTSYKVVLPPTTPSFLIKTVFSTGKQQTINFDSFENTPTGGSVQAVTHLPAGKTLFEVNHYLGGSCTNVKYPATICSGETSSSCPSSPTSELVGLCHDVTEASCLGIADAKYSSNKYGYKNACLGTSSTQCSSATPEPPAITTTHINLCYLEGMGSCPSGSTPLVDGVDKTAVIKPIIPHKAIPKITW